MGRRQELHVLLVEDDKDDQEIVSRSCRGMNRLRCTLDWARSFVEARALILKGEHHLVLVGLELGDAALGGIGRAFPHLPVIVLTHARPQRLDLEAPRGSAQGHLIKEELTPKLLEGAIERAMGRHRPTRMDPPTAMQEAVDDLDSPLAEVRAVLVELKEGIQSDVPKDALTSTAERALDWVEHIRSAVQALYPFPSVQRVSRPSNDDVLLRSSTCPAGGRARVLWIDDDVHLLRAFQRRLHRDHDVDVCLCAQEALDRIEAGERWEVICCDLMMPNMSGREFEEVLAQRFPELACRIIFVTGGVFTEEERRFLQETERPRLLKPFDWETLLDAVDEVRSRPAA